MESKNNTKDSRVKVKVVGIEWDTDGESVNLPQYDIIEMTQEEYELICSGACKKITGGDCGIQQKQNRIL